MILCVRKNKGFTFLEYCLLLIIVVAAFMAMRVYLQRAVMGRWKNSIDTISHGRQF